jgi:hypothetical protein
MQLDVYVGNSKELERLNSERKDMENLIVRGKLVKRQKISIQ